MGDFVQLPVTVTAADLEDIAVANMQASTPGWTGEHGDPEIILIESVSPIAESLAVTLANMPKSALIALGVLLGIPYGVGQSAYTNVQLTMQNNAGYTVNVYSSIIIDGYSFVLTADLVIPNGSTTGVGLFASTPPYTADANGLAGLSVSALAMPTFVTGYSVLAPTTGGQDPQTDDDYVDKVSRDRRFNTRAIIVPLDFELAALDVQGIARAHAEVPSAGSLVLTLLGSDGNVATAGEKAQVAALFTTGTKMVNVTVTLQDPTANRVSVTYQVQGEPGYDGPTIVATANSALSSELSGLTHGVPEAGDPGAAITTWINDPNIYYNRMIQVIGSVPGVHRVVSLTIGGSLQAKLSSALTTGGPITSLPISTTGGSSLVNTIPAGATVTINDNAGHTQNWTTTSSTAPGASSIAVASQTPNFAYPTTSSLSTNQVTGDYVMSGAVPIPVPGVLTGSAI